MPGSDCQTEVAFYLPSADPPCEFSFAFTVLLLAWALRSLYPPTARDLILVFQEQAEVVDTNLTAMVARAQELQKANSNQAFANLLAAVGTNDLARHFPCPGG